MTAPAEGRLLLRVSEAADRCGLSRTKLYELIAAGELEVVHIGAAARVPVDALEAFVSKLRAEQKGGGVDN